MPWGVEETEPEQILDALRQTGVRADGVEIDLAQPEGPHTLFTRAQERFGRIDILVNNAAYSTATRMEQLQSTRLVLPPQCCRHAQEMLGKGGVTGKIVLDTIGNHDTA